MHWLYVAVRHYFLLCHTCQGQVCWIKACVHILLPCCCSCDGNQQILSSCCSCCIQCCGFGVQDPLFGSVQQRFTGLVYNATALSYRIDPIIIHGAGGSPNCQHPVGLTLLSAVLVELILSGHPDIRAPARGFLNPEDSATKLSCGGVEHAAGHYLPETKPLRAAAEIIKFVHST